jgi:cytoskeletal protein CcmA (bactofilin family)
MTIRTTWLGALLAACCLVLSAPGWALAAEIRNDTTTLVAPGETIDDDLFATGETVTIGGHVTGDAYAAARTITVTGTIDGDLIAAAEQVIVDGTIAGNLRAAGATVTINGSIGRSVSGLAQHVNVSPTGRVGGSLLALAETVDAFGPVGRGLNVGGGTLELAGPVGGPVLARVETLSVAPTAHLAGSLDYQAKQEAALPSGTVTGEVRFAPTPQQAPRPAPLLNGLFDLGGLLWLCGTFLVGTLAVVLLPRAAARAVELGRQQPWQSFGLGLLVLVVTPIAMILIGLTLIGLPVSLSLAALYTLGLLLAWPAAGLVVGTELARRVPAARPLPVLGTLALGLVVLHLVTHLPFIGGLLTICGLILGLGLVAQAVRRWRRPTEQPAIAIPLAAAAA